MIYKKIQGRDKKKKKKKGERIICIINFAVL